MSSRSLLSFVLRVFALLLCGIAGLQMSWQAPVSMILAPLVFAALIWGTAMRYGRWPR